jgi:uncharacterized protein YegP (UPF0339 family)
VNPELLTGIKDAKQARAAAWKARQEFKKSPEGKFTRSMKAAMGEYLRMREQGVSRDDAVKGIEAVLRATWPFKTREKQTCDSCDGTGWRLKVCQHMARCARERICWQAEPEWEHDYVVPCDCELGDRFKPAVRSAEQELASVGRKKPAKSGGWRKLSE